MNHFNRPSGPSLPAMIEHTEDASFRQDQVTVKDGPKSSVKDHGPRRRLNPAFVCQLMAWPWYWTNPEPISFAQEATESFLSAARWHLSNLLEGRSPTVESETEGRSSILTEAKP